MLNCETRQENCNLSAVNEVEVTISELVTDVSRNLDAILNMAGTIDNKLFCDKHEECEPCGYQPDGIEDNLKLIISKCNAVGNILSNVNSRL